MRRSVLGWLAVLFLLAAVPARAEEPGGTLDSWNRAVFSLNRTLRGHAEAAFERVSPLLPELPAMPALREGASNLLATWIAEPWNAATLALAGQDRAAGDALRRVWTNILEGAGGTRDVATARGLPVPPPADLGLALCARGVPDGPFVVFPVVGGRTLRDGLADLVLANALIYAALVPFTGPVPSLETIIVVETLDNIAIWSLASELDAVAGPTRTELSYEEARARTIAARAAACAALKG